MVQALHSLLGASFPITSIPMHPLATQTARSFIHLTPPGADLEFHPAFLPADEAPHWFTLLSGEECIRWRQDHIRIHGRSIPLPRLTSWYGEPGVRYRYSGIVNEAIAWDGPLRALAERVAREARTPFNGVLLNLYRDENDGVSWHSDDEPELGAEPVIASLSLGATRLFQLRHKDSRRNGLPWEELRLGSGSLLVMRGSTQRHWQHRLPKQIGRPCGARVNLSFRWISADET
jgi:alkylated DNA repair dioxygenase AlkB